MADSPGSSLSSLSSDAFPEDVKTEERDPNFDTLPEHIMHPAKRQRIGTFSYQSTPVLHLDQQEALTDISSDTSGEVPDSPRSGLPQMPDDDGGHEQVSVCRWEGCPAGDLGNMDVLVSHIHEDHIGSRQKAYSCQWDDCQRKGSHHASGYALRAHMRSHTREKPFFCTLPECDRSFTRSDALAKHMRTVHETEALRPSDPIPKSHSTANGKPQRLKLVFNAKPPADEQTNGFGIEADNNAIAYNGGLERQGTLLVDYPSDIQFTEQELAMTPKQLFSLLRRQVHWAEEEGAELRGEVTLLEVKRKKEWQAKELLLANVMEAELAKALDFEEYETILKLKNDLPHPMLPISGGTPYYREPPTHQSAIDR